MDLKTATLTKHTDLTHNVFQLEFKTDDPSFTYKAGQFVTIKIPQPEGNPLTMRSYSISSKPSPGRFELCVKLIEDGAGSNYLNKLAEGSSVEFLGPVGHFTFTNTPDKQALFIGTGTGLAPLKSIIEDELGKGNSQQMHLIFGVRHEKDVFYQDLLANLAKKHENFTYDITLSRPESPDWQGAQGRVTTLLESMKVDPATTETYICGLKDMVLDVTALLEQKGISKEAIHFERFN